MLKAFSACALHCAAHADHRSASIPACHAGDMMKSAAKFAAWGNRNGAFALLVAAVTVGFFSLGAGIGDRRGDKEILRIRDEGKL